MNVLIFFVFGLISGLSLGYILWHSPKGIVIECFTDENTPEPETPE